VDLGLFAEGRFEELVVSAGQWVGFVALVWVSSAGMGTGSGGILGEVEVVLNLADAAGQTLGMIL